MSEVPLRLGGVPEHVNLPWHLAREGAALAETPTIWTDQPGGTGQMLEALAGSTLDLVSILTEGTVAAIAGGLPVTILQVYVASPLQWGVFAPAGAGLSAEADLEGRPVAISRRRSGSHLMAFVQAQRNGWELDDSQFVITGGLDGAREAFADGRASTFLWDQYMTRPLVRGGEFVQLGVEETPWPSFVIAVRNEVLAARTSEVGAVIDAVVAEAQQLHGRAGVVDEIALRFQLGTDTVEAWLASTTFAARTAWDPSVGAEVLATLAAAGFTD